jgi:hypothetical protein
MGSPPASDRPSPARRRVTAPPMAAPAEPHVSPARVLLHSWAGRLFLASTATRLLLAPFRGDAPLPLQILGAAAAIGLVVSVGWFVWRLVALAKRRLLWRVRRKLIISYIFMGLVPAALIIGFFVVGAHILSLNVSAYMFRNGLEDVVSRVALMAEAGAGEIARAPAATRDTIERVHRVGSRHYGRFSVAFVPASPEAPAAATAGPWDALPAPDAMPPWVEAAGFAGPVVSTPHAKGRTGRLAWRSGPCNPWSPGAPASASWWRTCRSMRICWRCSAGRPASVAVRS